MDGDDFDEDDGFEGEEFKLRWSDRRCFLGCRLLSCGHSGECILHTVWLNTNARCSAMTAPLPPTPHTFDTTPLCFHNDRSERRTDPTMVAAKTTMTMTTWRWRQRATAASVSRRRDSFSSIAQNNRHGNKIELLRQFRALPFLWATAMTLKSLDPPTAAVVAVFSTSTANQSFTHVIATYLASLWRRRFFV